MFHEFPALQLLIWLNQKRRCELIQLEPGRFSSRLDLLIPTQGGTLTGLILANEVCCFVFLVETGES